jgi:hypothetical protein
MITGLLFAFAPQAKPTVPITPEHLDQSTMALWLLVAAVACFCLLRPALWRRVWIQRVDPRGPALARIAMGITVMWAWIDLAVLGEFLFTDQGLWLTEMARKNYGGQLKTYWDPEVGFEHWYDFFHVFESKWTILHVRSDPATTWTIFGLLYVFTALMIVGKWTRLSSVMVWLLANQLFNYSPIFYTGGDTVMRVMLFLGMFIGWGEAYSLDAWKRRRTAILGGASTLPPYRKILPWAIRLMMLQLAIIYCATGLLKSGSTWWTGSALYYAMNLDHFYRVPATGLLTVGFYSGALLILTWIVHWWEMLFPVVLIGVGLNAYERERKAGTWVHAPGWRRWLSWSLMVHFWLALAFVTGLVAFYYYEGKYIGLKQGLITKAQARWIAMGIVITVPILIALGYQVLKRRFPRAHQFALDWVFGKRFWLTLGFLFHLGIEISMNVGTFVQVMWAPYPVFLRGVEVDAFWRYLQTRAAKRGEGTRPEQPSPPAKPAADVKQKTAKKKPRKRRFDGLRRRLEPGWAFVRHRVPLEPYLVHHAVDELSIRRAALLRCWDLSHRLEFVADADAPVGQLTLQPPGSKERLAGAAAGARLCRIFPGLWPMWLVSLVPGAGAMALKILHQK